MNAPVPDARRRAFLLVISILLAATFSGWLALSANAVEPAPDPAAAGQYATNHVDYRAGRIALTLPKGNKLKASFDQPLRGSVTYPDSGADWPVAVFLHGRHATCLDSKGRDFIPFPGEDNPACRGSVRRQGRNVERRIRSYSGYGYIANRLTSQGYAVVSIDVNMIASYEYFSATAGIRARAQLVGATLDLMARWNSGKERLFPEAESQPGTDDLAGQLDLGHIALMGHSRGGDAVTQFIAFNKKRSTVYPLGGVVAIGPTDMSEDDPFRNGGTNLAEILPACDGDVFDLQGGHVFERVKNSRKGESFAKYQWLLGGTNHNWFNTVWKEDDAGYSPTTALDSACNRQSPTSTRLGRAGQRSAGLSLVSGFVRTYAGGETQFATGLETGAPAPGVRASYVAPKVERKLIIGPARKSPTTRNNVGGSIRKSGLTLSWCDPKERSWQTPVKKCPGFTGSDESVTNRSWTRQLVIDWKRKSRLTTELPAAAADASAFSSLVFRAVTTVSGRNPVPESNQQVGASAQRMDVVLADRAGNEHSVAAESYSTALDPTVGDRTRQLLLSDIRIPLADFTGVNLADVASVRFEFGNRGRTHGQIQVADLAFQGSTALPFAAPRSDRAPGPVAGPGTAIDAILTATANGGTPVSARCVNQPSATLDSGPVVTDGRLVVSGRLQSDGCDSRVQVALFERDGELCRFASSEGRLGYAEDCGRPYSLVPEVSSDGRWTVSIPWTEGSTEPEVKLAAVPL